MAAPRPEILWIGSPNFRVQNGISKVGAVLHWMVGNLAGTDRSFVQSAFGVATQYGVENGVIHQYVDDKDYAFGTGDTYANSRLIATEHAGGWILPDGTRMKPTEQTHMSSAALHAYLGDFHGWGPLQVGVNMFGHDDFINTECPGTLDLYLIAALGQAIREGRLRTGANDMQVIKDNGSTPNSPTKGWTARVGEIEFYHHKNQGEQYSDSAAIYGNYLTVRELNSDEFKQVMDLTIARRAQFIKEIAAAIPAGSGGSGATPAQIAAAVDAALTDNFGGLQTTILTKLGTLPEETLAEFGLQRA